MANSFVGRFLLLLAIAKIIEINVLKAVSKALKEKKTALFIWLNHPHTTNETNR